MKASELRTGNYVYDDESNDVMVVAKIETIEYTKWNSGDEFSIVCKKLDSDSAYYEGYFRPINLTEEWVFKLGFEKVKIPTALKDFYIEYYKKDNFIVYLLKDSFEIELITKSGEQFNLYTNFKKEVHILQNVFYSLTSTEL